jgi:multidrug transporter EmrE-like cation transporter
VAITLSEIVYRERITYIRVFGVILAVASIMLLKA